MSNLHFYYGVMNSSKTAQALMCRFNYIQKGFNVLLLKSSIDNRFETDRDEVISRIGIQADCIKFSKEHSILDIFNIEDEQYTVDLLIVDECQFLSTRQVEELKEISSYLPVFCYGLLTNFKTQMFEGSKRLVELADNIEEIKSVCSCGEKAIVNARLVNGKVSLEGKEILLGAEETYQSMCYNCYKKALEKDDEKIDEQRV